MDKNSVFGEVLEKGQNAVANTASNVATNTASDLSQTVAEQMGMQTKSQQQVTNQTSIPNIASANDSLSGAQTSEASKEIVEDFYSPSDNSSLGNQPNTAASLEPEIQAKLAKVREELHKDTYYDPLFAYENKKPEPRKAEVMEQAESQKMQELAISQQKQSEDIAKTRAQIAVEANRGVAG